MTSNQPLLPLVSVVIPAFNEEHYLPHLLKSLKNQTYKHFEIVVVNNNSTDKTAEIAEQFGARVISDKTRGIADARQKGTLATKGDIIAGTDADSIVPPNWLEKIVVTFAKDETTVICGGPVELYDGPFSARFVTKYFLYPFALFDKWTSGGWNFSGNNTAFRKTSFDKTQGYNPEIIVGEDHDISIKLRRVGKAVYLKNLVVQVSGRRFKKGFFNILFKTYIYNFLTRLFLKKETHQEFKPVR